VYIAVNDGSGQFTVLCGGDPCVEDYSPAQGYSDFGNNPRYLSDMTGDGLDDIVAFSDGGVIIAQASGTGFVDPDPGNFAIRRFGPNSGGWTEGAPRVLADVNGDGFEDIIGFGFNQTALARARPDRTPPLFSNTATYDTLFVGPSWDVDENPRVIVDINNDEQDDVVAFSNNDVLLSLAIDREEAPNGALTPIGSVRTISSQFSINDGWQPLEDPRYFADVDGDGYVDLVGFGSLSPTEPGAVYYSLNPGQGGVFGTIREWVPEFSSNRGFTFDANPRFMGDVDGDGRSDIIVFDDSTVEVVFALTSE
ncbi:MAG: VCBS repeat-containing protein, partial [Pseudomonadota bacterium]